MDCPEVMGPYCLITEEEVAAAIKGLKIGNAAGPTGVVSEMMNASGKSGPGGSNTICTKFFNRCDSSTACMLCRLEHIHALQNS